MLIRSAGLLSGRVVDIRVGSRIECVEAELDPRSDETVFDASGCTVIPGLHDHHVHLRAAAAIPESIELRTRSIRTAAGLAAVLTATAPGGDGWIRVVGYHESMAGPLDRTVLDRLAPAVPVRIQHRSGVLWMLNSAGLRKVGLSDHPDGRLLSRDPQWSEELPRRETSFSELSRRFSDYGVTSLTDATPDLGSHPEAAGLRQHVSWLSPGKRILHDDELDLDELTAWIGACHADGVAVALHCVTAAQLVVAIAALKTAGTHPRDRIEHAAIVPSEMLGDLAQLRVVVVTQPNFVAERGDRYLAEVDRTELAGLWRIASLLDAGVRLAFSTDAPFGDPDPWAAMRAAVSRRTPSGVVLGGSEKVSPHTALQMFLGSAERPDIPRRISPGEPGDLCLLRAAPADVLDQLDSALVLGTVVAGSIAL